MSMFELFTWMSYIFSLFTWRKYVQFIHTEGPHASSILNHVI